MFSTSPSALLAVDAPPLTPEDVVRTAAFFLGAFLIVAIAKVLRDLIARRQGRSLGELIVQRDNVAVGVEMAGFVLAMVLGLLGSLVVYGDTWYGQAGDLLLTGGIVFAVLILSDQLISRIVLRGLDCNAAVADDANLAVAIVRATGNVATALVLRGALGHDSPLGERLIWVGLGLVALVVLSLAYQVLTRYDDVAEVRHKNVAAALPMGGILLAVGLVVEAAVSGEGSGWGPDLVALVLDLSISAILIVVLRWTADKLLLPGATFHDEIARDKNAGVGMLEAGTTLAVGLAVAYFLN